MLPKSLFALDGGLVARPPAEIVATAMSEEAQVTAAVRSWLVPLLKNPKAASCAVKPNGIVGSAPGAPSIFGKTPIDVN